MQLLTIDFETTYSKTYSLSKMTTEAYVNDPQFEVVGVAVKINEEPTQWFTGNMMETAQWLAQFDWGNSIVVAHNALFDGAILGWRFNIHPKVIVCTLCMARALHAVSVGGSLAAMSEYYGLGKKGTEVHDAIGKRRADFSQAEIEAYGGYCVNDVELTYKLFQAMLPNVNKAELKLIDITIRMYTNPMLKLDREVLDLHLIDVREQKDRLLEECGIVKEDLMSNNKLAVVLESLGVEVPMKLNSKGAQAFAFAKTDEGFKALAEHDDLRVQAIVAARLGTKSTLEETRTERFIAIAERPNRKSFLPVPLLYYGARTGRWAGGADRINLQNIPRKSKLKSSIVAPEGHVIIGADLSAIELRMGLAFAGQLDKMNMLGAGVDLYKDFAAQIYNIGMDEVTDSQRFMGKTSQLSLIYGTGAVKLRNQVKMMSGVDIGEEEAKRIVEIYRSEYTSVVAAWREGDKVLDAVAENSYITMGRNDLIQVHGSQGAMLPSGLYMRYPDLVKERVGTRYEWSVMKNKRERDKLYGSKVYQGLTQALARCIIAEAMLRVDKRYRIGLTIHDALYVIAPEDEADEALRFIITQLRRAPDWMPDIPLDAEGGFGRSLEFKMGKII
jgi:DNA polymerase